jgi:hypothetical protein
VVVLRTQAGRRGLSVQAERLRLERGAGRREGADGGRHARGRYTEKMLSQR